MASISYIGASNLIATNGGAPGAITPNASTQNGDLLIFYHYGRAAGGNETVSLTGWTQEFQAVTAGQGHVAVFYRIRQAGDTSYTATVTNYTSGTTGETILEWIETYRNHNPTDPLSSVSSALSTWTSSLNLGPISAPASPTLLPEDMVVVFAGRFENISGQTILTGDNLVWNPRTINDTTQGSDAGAVTQTGLNGNTTSQTVTAKTITTTGTAQVGAGIMFIIRSIRDGAVTETTSATDTTDETLDASASISESATASDSTNGGVDLQLSATESTSSSETSDAQRSLSVSIAESTSSSDSSSTTRLSVVSVSETTSSLDSSSVNRTSPVSVSETTASSDSTNGVRVTLVSASESTSALDSTNSTSTSLVSLSEPASATESVDYGGGAVSATISETTSASDSSSVNVSSSRSISESASASDTVSSSLLTSVVITETASASESSVGTRLAIVVVNESANALDSYGSVSQFLKSINESATASDICDGGYKGLFKINTFTVHVVGLNDRVTFDHTVSGGYVQLDKHVIS